MTDFWEIKQYGVLFPVVNTRVIVSIKVMWMYAFPRRWHLLRSALSVGQSNTAEGQCVRSVALSCKSEQEIVLHRERNRVYQARKRARESERETVER